MYTAEKLRNAPPLLPLQGSPSLVVAFRRIGQQDYHAGEADESAERAHVVEAAEVLDALDVVVPDANVAASRQCEGRQQIPNLNTHT